ncbi:MAG: hypothetical protein AB8C46_07625 [Burkholderiaceae bacterium]
MQALSGSLLAAFLLIHVSAVVAGRLWLGLDTNAYFAAAGFHVSPNQLFFVPYYFLAVTALFVHIGCAIYWALTSRSPEAGAIATGRRALLGFAVVGSTFALGLVLAMAGALYPLQIPSDYTATYVIR